LSAVFSEACFKVASGALRRARCSGRPALRPFGAILRMSKFVPDKFVSHSDTSPKSDCLPYFQKPVLKWLQEHCGVLVAATVKPEPFKRRVW